MTKKEILNNNYIIACSNLLNYSSNYLMTESRKGYEELWKKAKEEVELLEIMIKEYPENNEFLFIGTITTSSFSFNEHLQENHIEFLIISDREDNKRMFSIDYEIGNELIKIYEKEKDRRYELNKSTEIIFTVENSSQKIIKWEWKES